MSRSPGGDARMLSAGPVSRAKAVVGPRPQEDRYRTPRSWERHLPQLSSPPVLIPAYSFTRNGKHPSALHL